MVQEQQRVGIQSEIIITAERPAAPLEEDINVDFKVLGSP